MNLEIKLDEMARDIAMRALDEATYEGKTMREWIDLIKIYTEGKGDLISRNALLQTFEKLKNNPNNGLRDVLFLDGAMSVIDNAPALDAVPVIRCRDCVLRSSTCFCGSYGHYVSGDFFCAYGTTEIIRKPGPAKKTEKKTEERCGSTGLPCSRCTPGPCDHRRMVIPDDSGQ